MIDGAAHSSTGLGLDGGHEGALVCLSHLKTRVWPVNFSVNTNSFTAALAGKFAHALQNVRTILTSGLRPLG